MAVDRLNIVAHDKFQEIIDEAGRPGSSIHLQPEIQAAIVKAVEAQHQPVQLALDGFEEKTDIAAVVAKTVEMVAQQTIDIPRIIVLPRGEVKSGFAPFTLALDTMRYQAVSDELWIQQLLTNEREVLSLGRAGNDEARLEDYVVAGLIDFDDISYDMKCTKSHQQSC